MVGEKREYFSHLPFIVDIKAHLMDELEDEVLPTTRFSLGYLKQVNNQSKSG